MSARKTPALTGSTFSQYAKIQAEKRSAKSVIPLVKEFLLSQWQPGHPDGDDFVHPSEMSKKDWCERATWYRVHMGWQPEDKFNFNLQTIFDEGHQIHDKWQTWLKGTGKLWGDWECISCGRKFNSVSDELPSWPDDCVSCLCHLDYEHGTYPCGHDDARLHVWQYREVALAHENISGHEDGAVGDRLVEFKSVGIGTLRAEAPSLLSKFYNKPTKTYDLDGLWRAMDKPFRSHVKQANIYMWLASQMFGPGRFPQCSIVYEFKPNQQSREYVISMSEEIVEPLIARARSVDSARPPKCPFRGCKYCKAAEAELQDGFEQQNRSGARLPSRASGTVPAVERRTLVTRRSDGTVRQQSHALVP